MDNPMIAYKGRKRFYLKTVSWRNTDKFHVIEFELPTTLYEYRGSRYLTTPMIRGKILRHGFCFDSREQAEHYLAKYLKHSA